MKTSIRFNQGPQDKAGMVCFARCRLPWTGSIFRTLERFPAPQTLLQVACINLMLQSTADVNAKDCITTNSADPSCTYDPMMLWSSSWWNWSNIAACGCTWWKHLELCSRFCQEKHGCTPLMFAASSPKSGQHSVWGDTIWRFSSQRRKTWAYECEVCKQGVSFSGPVPWVSGFVFVGIGCIWSIWSQSKTELEDWKHVRVPQHRERPTQTSLHLHCSCPGFSCIWKFQEW